MSKMNPKQASYCENFKQQQHASASLGIFFFFKIRQKLCNFMHFWFPTFSLNCSWANLSKWDFFQFAHHSFYYLAPEIKVSSRAMNKWAIWKSKAPSSDINMYTYMPVSGYVQANFISSINILLQRRYLYEHVAGPRAESPVCTLTRHRRRRKQTNLITPPGNDDLCLQGLLVKHYHYQQKYIVLMNIL